MINAIKFATILNVLTITTLAKAAEVLVTETRLVMVFLIPLDVNLMEGIVNIIKKLIVIIIVHFNQ